jgi:hypothetical protein
MYTFFSWRAVRYILKRDVANDQPQKTITSAKRWNQFVEELVSLAF